MGGRNEESWMGRGGLDLGGVGWREGRGEERGGMWIGGLKEDTEGWVEERRL